MGVDVADRNRSEPLWDDDEERLQCGTVRKLPSRRNCSKAVSESYRRMNNRVRPKIEETLHVANEEDVESEEKGEEEFVMKRMNDVIIDGEYNKDGCMGWHWKGRGAQRIVALLAAEELWLRGAGLLRRTEYPPATGKFSYSLQAN